MKKETRPTQDFQVVTNNNNLSINLIRIISTFLVVLAHINSNGEPKWLKDFYYTVTRMGVPLFFMCIGYLLLSKRETIAEFLKKHLLPLLISFFVWSAIYAFIGDGVFQNGITSLQAFKTFLHIIKSATVGYYWFFYSLIGMYLFVPILWVFLPKNRTKEINYYIGLWLLGFSIMPFVRSAIGMDYYGLEPPFVQRYLGYFLLGYYLAGLRMQARFPFFALGLFAVSFAFSFSVFYFNLPPTDNEDFFRSYMSINIVCMAASLYMLLNWAGNYLPENISIPLEIIDQSIFGIYLGHLIVLGKIQTLMTVMGLQGGFFSVVPVIALVAFIISFLLITLLRKIPVINYAIPHIGK
jgi:surface polysaccharide O-acyltransferase-like enzyme